MNMASLDVRGVGVFLLLTFGGGYLLQLVLLLTGVLDPFEPGFFGYIAIAAIVLWPGIAALLARQWAPLDKDFEYTVWPLPTVNTLRIVATVPLVFLMSNLIASIPGWTAPDWRMTKMVHLVKQAATQPLPSEIEPMLPAVMLVGGLGFSVLLGVLFYAPLLFGLEYAFRGYLLPKLSHLGKWPSVALAAIGPFLYGIPFVVYSHVVAPEALDDLPESLFRVFAPTFSSGLLLGMLWIHTRHLGLIAVAAGSIVAHVYGVWDSLFAMQYYWFTGSTGLIVATLWTLLAVYPKAFVSLPR